jgi:DeoR family glycerol-3-phosphate regulon repressor
MAGGELRSDSGAAFGVSAIEFVSRFSVTHAVISVGAVDAASASWTTIWTRPSSPAWFFQRGARAVVVTDHSKFGRHGLVKVCDFSVLGELVTDRAPPAMSPQRWRKRA